MAKTSQGVEFYLLEVYEDKQSTPLADVADILRSAVRDTDGVIDAKDRLYIAFAGDVQGAAKATRRLMTLTKKAGVNTRYRLVVEPFPKDLWNIANRVIEGEVRVFNRDRVQPEEPEVDFLE